MGGPNDSDDERRLTNSRRDFLHLSGIGAMGLSGIGAASGSAFASTGTGHVLDDVSTGVRPATDTESVFEGFEDGDYTDTFENTSESNPSLNPNVTGSHAHSGNYALMLDSFRGTNTRNSVDSIQSFTGSNRYSAYVKPTEIAGGQGTIGMQLNVVGSDEYMLIQSSGWYGGILVRPHDETGDRISSRAETFGEVLPVGEWSEFSVEVRSSELHLSVAGHTYTYDTQVDWTQRDVRLRLMVNGWGGGHAHSAVYDDVEVRGVQSAGDGICADSARFCDDWSDGDYTSSPPWEVYQGEGREGGDGLEAEFDIRSRSDIPQGGPNVLRGTTTSGASVAWANGQRGWDDAWTLSGLFHTEQLPPDAGCKRHGAHGIGIQPAGLSEKSGNIPSLLILLGFQDCNTNKPLKFKIVGAEIDTVQTEHDPGWQENTWYHYEVSHDGAGTYEGKLWKDGVTKPAEPQAKSVGSVSSDELGAYIGFPDGRGQPVELDHAYMKWVEGTPEEEEQKVTPRQEPVDGVTLDNGQGDELNEGILALEVSELESADWSLGDGSGLFYEGFALVAGDEVVPCYRPASIEESMTGDGLVNTPYTGSARYEIEGVEVLVRRTVRIHPSEDLVKFNYEIDQVGGPDDVDVDFLKYVDFDLAGADGDVAEYLSSPAYVHHQTEDGSIHAGVRGWSDSLQGLSDQPTGHHLGPYAEYDTLEAGDLSERDKFPDTGSGDPVSILRFNLGSIEPASVESSDQIEFVVGFSDSQETLESDLLDNAFEVQEPALLDQDLPKSAVEPNETSEGNALFALGDFDASEVSYSIDLRHRYRGEDIHTEDITDRTADDIYEPTVLDELPIDIPIEIDEQDLIDVNLSFDAPLSRVDQLPSGARSSLPDGSGIEQVLGYGVVADIELSAPGIEDSAKHTIRSYCFKNVETIDVIPARAANLSQPEPRAKFQRRLRDQAGKLNAHYASGLGTMGAEGRAFYFPTFDAVPAEEDHVTIEDGWIVLPFTKTDYQEHDYDETLWGDTDGLSLRDLPEGMSKADFQGEVETLVQTHAVQLASHAETLDLNASQQPSSGKPTVLVAAHNDFGGDPDDDDLQEFSNAFHYSSGKTEKMYQDGLFPRYWNSVFAYDVGKTWTHELGHNLHLPDFYGDENIYGWGLMASGNQISAYARAVDNFGSGDSDWLAQTAEPVTNDDAATIGLSPLSEAVYGETIQYPVAAKEIKGAPGGFTISERYYVAEARRHDRSYVAQVRNPSRTYVPGPEIQNSDKLALSPASRDGIALYDAGEVRFDLVESEGPPGGYLDYMLDNGKDSPTLTILDDIAYDPLHLMRFRLENNDISPASVAVDREVPPTVIEEFLRKELRPIRDALTFSVRVAEYWLQRHIPFGNEASPAPEALPLLDVVIENEAGDRAGTDPVTGEELKEIPGAYVTGKGSERTVLVPGSSGLTVSVSADRLLAELADRGVDVDGLTVPAEQTVIVDTDPELTEAEDHHVLEGRALHRTTTQIDDGSSVALAEANLDVKPERINPRSQGEFVTAHVSLDSSVDPATIDLSSTTLESVSAVSDESYGFVRNIPIDTRNGQRVATIKFPRQPVLERLDRGTTEVTISGSAGEKTFLGTTTVEVREPGGGNGSNGNGRS